METLEELKRIRDNAPEGSTHYSVSEQVYYRFKCECWMWCRKGSSLFQFVQDDDEVCDDLRSLSDINRIIDLMEVESDIRAALKAANIQNRKLLDKTENLKEKIKDIGYSYRRVEQERDELRILKFKKFNEEECWLYQGDGHDYLESLVCPVVISPEKLIDIIEGDL